MHVLSLFDGMSCGRIALERAGIEVTNYFSCEIDKYAVKVSEDNYPDITRLGDINNWHFWGLDPSKIDLILAGSPCQGFSFAGKQLAFNDPRSALFFTFIDILNWVKAHNPNVKFLLENVKMKKEHLAVITDRVGVEPVLINSALVSAQNRQRYYWCNWDVKQPEDKGIHPHHFSGQHTTTKILAHKIEVNRKYRGNLGLVGHYKGNSNSQRVYSLAGKMPTLLANSTGGNNPLWVSTDHGKTANRASVEFFEFLQTLPSGYTDSATENQRYKMLGNGWTVDVITHIFRSWSK
jgi:site-specific DNA-cytosine methylase